MNYDKQLKKYATKLENPKYYTKITKILMKADKMNYEFKDFNDYDLSLITGIICNFYDETPIENEDKIIKYLNDVWFIVTDKHYIIAKTPNHLLAVDMIIRIYFVVFLARLKQLFCFDRIIDIENLNNDVFMIKGALKTAAFLNTDVSNLDEFEVCKTH